MGANRHTAMAFGVLAISLLVASGVVAALSANTTMFAGLPVVAIAAAIAFAVQWIAFVPAFVRQTEHFYDLTGSLTYLTVVWFALLAAGTFDTRAVLLTLMVSAWALRLGAFLFRRVRRSGSDSRFDEIKRSGPRFFIAWTLQGLWVFLTACAALAAITAVEPPPLGVLDVVGAAIWVAGFGIEIVADRQKGAFRKNHPGTFITTGLWSWSRHPNYFGEIVLWCGVAVMAATTFQGLEWVALISPVFVIVLLTTISGVPLLEQSAEKRWGDDPEYQAYRDRTSVLILRPPARR